MDKTAEERAFFCPPLLFEKTYTPTLAALRSSTGRNFPLRKTHESDFVKRREAHFAVSVTAMRTTTLTVRDSRKLTSANIARFDSFSPREIGRNRAWSVQFENNIRAQAEPPSLRKIAIVGRTDGYF